MSTHKHIDRICLGIMALVLAVTILFMNGEKLGIQAAARVMGYEDRLFDTSTVHTINIIMEDWEGFLENCTDEEYVECTVVIDNEAYKNVAIRAKGNTSLTQVASYGNDRYSFKIEFDHYDSTKTYYGLDKLCLNNIIQDNTYMKDYLTYQLMNSFGVNAPLSSYAQILVNGEEWGLYLAVEGVEDGFLERCYGSHSGELYKPDSQSMGGGRGNGGDFSMGQWQENREDLEGQTREMEERFTQEDFDPGKMPQDFDPEDLPEDFAPEEFEPGAGGPGRGGFGGGGMGSDDVSLIYTDDDYNSYSNIFDNAKTDITDSDKDRLIQSLEDLNNQENLESVVDMDQVLRYFVVHNFVCNFDSYTGSMIHNYYLYEEDGQLAMIPWDYNLAFGGFMGSSDGTSLVNYPIDTPVSGGTVDSRPMLSWIFSSEEYTQRYHDAFAQFLEEIFDSGAFTQLIQETQALIAPYVESDPTKFCTYDEFLAGVDTLEQFCLLRAQSIAGQLEGTIPSTQEGQQEDSSALIDGSQLDISQMGSMNVGGGMDRGDRPDGFGSASDQDIPQMPGSGQDRFQEGAESQTPAEGIVPPGDLPDGAGTGDAPAAGETPPGEAFPGAGPGEQDAPTAPEGEAPSLPQSGEEGPLPSGQPL